MPRRARSITCTYCNTRLSVQQEGGAAWTETLEDLREDVRVLRRKAELAELDRAWQEERASYVIHGERGRTSMPSAGGGIAAVAMAVIFGGLWTVFAIGIGAGAPGPFALFPLIGVAIIGFGVFSGMRTIGRAQEFESALERYRSRRKALLDDGTD